MAWLRTDQRDLHVAAKLRTVPRSRSRRVCLLVAILGVLTFTTSALGARAASTVPAAGTTSTTGTTFTGALMFVDSFNGKKGAPPTPGKWTDYSACSYNGSAAFGDIKCGNNEKLDGVGHLSIPATPTAGSGIRVASKYAFKYGVFSAWMKLPSQVGYWPAFWTLNNGYNGVDKPLLGETDVMEGYSTWPTLYHVNAHNWLTDGRPNSGSVDSVCGKPSLSSTFHKYSAKIQPGKITFYLDSVQCGVTFTPQTNPGKAYGFGPTVTRGNWLILDLAVGGAGGQQRPATHAARLLVDRVEVRKLA